MKIRDAGFRLSPSHYKIIETVLNLNIASAYPSSDGIGKILGGIIDQETKPFEATSTFATLLSYRGRKLCSQITNLVRRGYLTYFFSVDDNGKYLKITDLGTATIAMSKKTLPSGYRRKEKKIKKTIVYK
jgi:hypothetical protein